MENDHSLKIAERLLALKASIAPTVEVIESLSEEMRQLVTENGNRQIEAVVAGLGVVSVSAAAAERLKGLEDVLNFANWLTLDDTERDRLRALKVVESVKVSLDLASPQLRFGSIRELPLP